MKNTLLITVATAALVVGAGLASAQGTKQMAPAEKAGTMSEPKGAAETKAPDAGMKADGRAGTKDAPPTGMNANEKTSGDTNTKSKADTKGAASSSDKARDTNTGQGAAGTAAKMSPEQRTTVRTVIKQQNVQPLTNVTFSLSVGTKVPRTVHFYPLPVELVQINPSWRGYEFVLVGDQIIVINPRTLEIVAVLET